MRVTNLRALQYFLKNGVLATLRSYPYLQGSVIYIESGMFDKMKACVETVIKLKSVGVEYLHRYLAWSGYNTLEEWINGEKQLSKSPIKYLVVVRKYGRMTKKYRTSLLAQVEAMMGLQNVENI